MTVMPVVQIAAVDPPQEAQRPSVPSDVPPEITGEKKEPKKAMKQADIEKMLDLFNA